jgi:hypothetical protein
VNVTKAYNSLATSARIISCINRYFGDETHLYHSYHCIDFNELPTQGSMVHLLQVSRYRPEASCIIKMYRAKSTDITSPRMSTNTFAIADESSRG